ncbi:MAG: two-component regulator propeller domain-containing protein [Saprospiraceae bacterium]
MKYLFILIGGWVIGICTANSQEINPFIHHLTVEDGLLQARNDFVYKDSMGFVWISSLNGLNVYDGKKIRTFQPDFEDTTSIFGQNIQSPFFETNDGDIIFTTYEGINIYNRKHDSFSHVVVPDNLHFYYAFHLDPEGKLWFVNNTTYLYTLDLFTLKLEKLDSFPSNIYRVTPLLNTNGYISELWAFSFQEAGVHIFRKQGEQFIKEHHFGDDSQTPLFFSQIIFEDHNNVWCATETGLYSYNQVDKTLTQFNLPDVINSEANAVAFLNKDTILVGYENMGLYFFNKKKKTFISNISADITNPNSLSSSNISQIYVDNEKGIWLSIPGIGVDFFNTEKSQFSYFKIENPISKFNLNETPVPTGIVEDANGNIWCATMSNGLYILDKNKKLLKHFTTEQNNDHRLLSNRVIFIYKDREQRIWMVSWEGIMVIYPNGERDVIKNDSFHFLRVYQLEDGRMLIGCLEGGIFEIKQKAEHKFEIISIPGISRVDAYTTLWQSSQGLLYCCRDVSDILIMDPAKGYKIVGVIPLSGESEAFYENRVDGSIWIANSSGLVRLRKGQTDGDGMRFFTEKDGLPDRVIYGILPDRDSILWVSTNRGIASFNMFNFKVRQFGLADGLPSLANSSLAFTKLESGEMLFGTPQGFTNFFPENIKTLGIEAHPVITRILINDEENPELIKDVSGATNVNIIRSLTLPFEYNTISFNFAALEYSDPANTKFEYQMEGVDKTWVKNGSQNFARYSKMDVGEFTFKLRASNSEGKFSEPVLLAIKITPPFTQSPLFYALIILLVVSVFGLIIFIRNKRQEEIMRLEIEKREALELERQRIARDVHDDLGSGLSALSLQMAMAQYKTSPEEIKTELEKANLAAVDLSGKIREVIWTVSAKNDTLSNLISYLNQYAIDLLENTNIDLLVNLPEVIPQITVTGEYRRTTFLAFKEALNNMLKHANASQVAINFKLIGNDLHIIVADNGVGFDPKLLEQSSGNGLLNMQTRMRDIGSDCQFETSDKGATITFILKFKPT